jgi:hypothetical protein
VAKTPRTSSTLSFLRFSTSCGGIRSAVPPDLTADIYYQDITPADHNVSGSYIDPSTPMPCHTTGSSNSLGEHKRGFMSLASNSQIKLSKFQDKIEKIVLRNENVTSIRNWNHGIRLALNTSGKTHINALPMFEMLSPNKMQIMILIQPNSISTSASTCTIPSVKSSSPF